jgi:hypothetical protein
MTVPACFTLLHNLAKHHIPLQHWSRHTPHLTGILMTAILLLIPALLLVAGTVMQLGGIPVTGRPHPGDGLRPDDGLRHGRLRPHEARASLGWLLGSSDLGRLSRDVCRAGRVRVFPAVAAGMGSRPHAALSGLCAALI